ncbi:MAG: acetoacetate decarboxylase family protein [Deltaproteobacteria bacterium]|nr:acetoacetate decarboxylase family protein [Deltaproteobacteria bacterium]
MSLKGRLTKDRFGHNMPVHAPLYAAPPIYYYNAEAIGITYETDEEAAMDILPDGLELPSPVLATILLIRYPESGLGPYEEVILGLPCLFEGQERFYIPYIVVNTVAPLAAGREVWGFPKKLADIDIMTDEDMIIGAMERPTGNRIVTMGFRPEQEVEVEQPEGGGSIALRVIPSPEENAGPSVAELVEVPSGVMVTRAYSGTGWVQFESRSSLDPWHKLSVNQVVDANMRTYNQILGFGKVVKRY